ncbi:class I SAM-dependent methyltransferase [Gorillibacterium sp. CAU 1737]|uniref:class I SAM-dependent methyltransferase n=1 Tax=Gorillibacterium sp. CAU 1737 TaxID=3140362 RepID=UPI003261CD47
MTNPYKETLKKLEDSKHLISMVPIDEIIRFGHSIGLHKESKVLDLCCGYGTVLKVWHEAFGVSGVGVDIWDEAILIGRERLIEAGIKSINLIEGDVLQYQDTASYDVVICSETFDSIDTTLALGARFLKPQGVLAYQKVYAKTPNPPQELLDFEGQVLTLGELNKIFTNLGYFITHLATDSTGDWERYITWSAKRDLARLRSNPTNEEVRSWIDQWYRMYFDYRRPYEGQALFGLERL